ncbi:MAG: hypothetical protein PHD56_03615 [Anaerostipes sp.]|nr:hypothetical protein [Anaerostipes sp.]
MEESELSRDEKKRVLFNLMIGGYDAKHIPEDVAGLVKNEMEREVFVINYMQRYMKEIEAYARDLMLKRMRILSASSITFLK